MKINNRNTNKGLKKAMSLALAGMMVFSPVASIATDNTNNIDSDLNESMSISLEAKEFDIKEIKELLIEENIKELLEQLDMTMEKFEEKENFTEKQKDIILDYYLEDIVKKGIEAVESVEARKLTEEEIQDLMEKGDLIITDIETGKEDEKRLEYNELMIKDTINIDEKELSDEEIEAIKSTEAIELSDEEIEKMIEDGELVLFDAVEIKADIDIKEEEIDNTEENGVKAGKTLEAKKLSEEEIEELKANGSIKKDEIEAVKSTKAIELSKEEMKVMIENGEIIFDISETDLIKEIKERLDETKVDDLLKEFKLNNLEEIKELSEKDITSIIEYLIDGNLLNQNKEVNKK